MYPKLMIKYSLYKCVRLGTYIQNIFKKYITIKYDNDKRNFMLEARLNFRLKAQLCFRNLLPASKNSISAESHRWLKSRRRTEEEPKGKETAGR